MFKTKRLSTLILALGVITAMSLVAYASPSEILEDVKIARIEHVGKDSSKLKTNTLDNGKNEQATSNASYSLSTTNEIEITGIVNGIEFDVDANLYDSPANENVYIFDGSEKLNNYEVIYIAVEKEIQDSVKYFDNIDSQAYDFMIKLYMRTNNTDDIVIVEIFTNNNRVDDLMSGKQARTVDNVKNTNINQFWYAKIFEPIETVTEIPNISRSEDVVLNKADYIYAFNHLGAMYYQHFIIYRYINWPLTLDNSEEFMTMLKVHDEYTDVPSFPNENSDSTFLRIDSARIDIAVDSGNAVKYFSVDGLTHKSASASISLNFKTDVDLVGPLSVTLNYDESDNKYDLNTTDTHLDNGDGLYYRQLGIELDDGHRLEDKGHYFSAVWTIADYEETTRRLDQDFKVKFTYYMTNLLDYTHWINGTKTLSDTVSYDEI